MIGKVNFDEFVTAKHSALSIYEKSKADAALKENGGAEEVKDGSGFKEGKPTHDDDEEEDIFLEVAKQLMARSINTHIYLFLILTFLVLVSTSNILFQFIKCREFEVPGEDSQSYLYIDYSVDCSSARYSTAKTFAIVNIVICKLGRVNAICFCVLLSLLMSLFRLVVSLLHFQDPVGIPSLYAVLLYRERERLSDPVAMAKEEATAFPNVGYVKFLISACKFFLPYHVESD